MKPLLRSLIGIIIINIVSSCQIPSDAMQDDLVASMKPGKDEKVSTNVKEEISMTTLKDHQAMIKIMKDHPELMEEVLKDIVEASKSDTSMMSLLSKAVMGDRQLMHRKQQ